MKLLYCLQCLDVVALRRQTRECACRESAGRYEADDITAAVTGPCVVLGIDSHVLERAVRDQRRDGGEIRAFLVGSTSDRVVRVATLRNIQQLRRGR